LTRGLSKTEQKGKQAQAVRAAQTRSKIIEAAARLFGAMGFDHVAIDKIAAQAGVTEGAIYHHYANKMNLFRAVTEFQEASFVTKIAEIGNIEEVDLLLQGWQIFLQACKDPVFVQIVLVDSPRLLGRERWRESLVVRQVEQILIGSGLLNRQGLGEQDQQLLIRIWTAAMAEVALTLASKPDYDATPMFMMLINMLGFKPLKS
jgi:AcrR family transcriptional regulator